LLQTFADAKAILAANEFDKAIEVLNIIFHDKETGWLLKWKTQRLLKQAQKLSELAKKTLEEQILITPAPIAEIAKPIMPPPEPEQKITAPNLSVEPPPITPATPLPSIPVTPAPIEIKPEIPALKPIPQASAPSAQEAQDELNLLLGSETILPAEKPAATPPPSLPVTPEIPTHPAITPEKTTPAPPKPAEPKLPAATEILFPTLLAELPPETPEPAKKTTALPANKLFLFIGGAIFIIALAAGGSWVFQNYFNQPKPSVSVSPSVSATPTPQLPIPLFKMETQEIISLDNGRSATELLADFAATDETAGSFTQIVFSRNNAYLNLSALTQAIPVTLFDLLPQTCPQASSSTPDLCSESEPIKKFLSENKFSLFVYSESELKNQTESSSPFSEINQNLGRAGLIIALNNSVDTSSLADNLKQLEPKMIESLIALLLKNNYQAPTDIAFSDNNYENAYIRYLNLKGPSLSLDYSLFNNYLIFATSKESMHAVIDRLLLNQ
jgi:hypothetical protein